jgi:hypothetical protein
LTICLVKCEHGIFNRIYTQARQFPHLAGKTDAEVIAIYAAALRKRPRYVALRAARDIVLLLIGIGVIVGRRMLTGVTLGTAFMGAA